MNTLPQTARSPALCALLIAGLAATPTTPAAHAGTIVASTLGSPGGGTTLFFTPVGMKAMGFTTGSQALNMTDVVIDLTGIASGAVANVGIWAGSASAPTSLLHTLSTTQTLGAAGLYTYTPNETVTLNAGEHYWVVVSSQTGSFGWAGTPDHQTPVFQSEVGATLLTPANFVDGSFVSSTLYNHFRVNTDSIIIPLPSAGLAGLAGLLVVGAMRRRRF